MKIVNISKGIRFVNVGEAPPHHGPEWTESRQWEACVRYGFISAGQAIVYSKPLCSIKKDDIIAAYITGSGYVGIGEVKQEAVEIKDFEFEMKTLNDFNMDERIINGTLIINDCVEGLPYLRKSLFRNAYNEKTEFAIKVKWVEWVPKSNPYWKRNYGLFASRNIQCRINGKSTTLKYLEACFDLKFNFQPGPDI